MHYKKAFLQNLASTSLYCLADHTCYEILYNTRQFTAKAKISMAQASFLYYASWALMLAQAHIPPCQ